MALATESTASSEDKTGLRTGTEIAVLGMGTSWLRSQPNAACPGKDPSRVKPTQCGAARRVDILVRFAPRAETRGSTCDRDNADAIGSLYCLQQCEELQSYR